MSTKPDSLCLFLYEVEHCNSVVSDCKSGGSSSGLDENGSPINLKITSSSLDTDSLLLNSSLSSLMSFE
jgi:hypothetical protein